MLFHGLGSWASSSWGDLRSESAGNKSFPGTYSMVKSNRMSLILKCWMHTRTLSFSLMENKGINWLVIRVHVKCHADQKLGSVFKYPCASQRLLSYSGVATLSGHGSTSAGHQPHFSGFLLLHEINTMSKTESYSARTCSDAMSAFRRWKTSCLARPHT